MRRFAAAISGLAISAVSVTARAGNVANVVDTDVGIDGDFDAVLSLQPGSSPEFLEYTGNLVIDTGNGAVTIKDTGILNALDGTFFEFDRIAGGTRAFSDATGLLFSDGVTTPTGFQGTIAGQICGGPPADPILD
jgi:hypothetical protein